MIMRADGALRVMLNSPVFKGMTFGDAKNEEPTSKQIFLASNEEGRTVPLLLRVSHLNCTGSFHYRYTDQLLLYRLETKPLRKIFMLSLRISWMASEYREEEHMIPTIEALV